MSRASLVQFLLTLTPASRMIPEVLDFCLYGDEQRWELQRRAHPAGRIRIASKAAHEAMMGCTLDLSHNQLLVYECGSLTLARMLDEQRLMALGRSTALHQFKQVPVEQRCSCGAAQAHHHTAAVGNEVPMDVWSAIPDHERLAVGVGRSWRVTGLNLDYGVWLSASSDPNFCESLASRRGDNWCTA